MADQRLMVTVGERSVVLAVRHGDNWRPAATDLAEFLSSVPHDSKITFSYEHEREYCDPLIEVAAHETNA